jgi:hypothetical protein
MPLTWRGTAMDSRLVLDVFAGILVVAGPVLFIVFCMTFKEDPSDHPIYKRSEKSCPTGLGRENRIRRGWRHLH